MTPILRHRIRGHRSRGQTLVEFAFVFPILLGLLFFIIDGGRLVYSYSTLANAVRTGTRVAIVNQNLAGIENTIVSDAAGLNGDTPTRLHVDYVGYKVPEDPALSGPDPETAEDCDPVAPGCIAVVTAHYDFVPVTPGLGSVFGDGSRFGAIPVSSKAIMPVERAFVNP